MACIHRMILHSGTRETHPTQSGITRTGPRGFRNPLTPAIRAHDIIRR